MVTEVLSGPISEKIGAVRSLGRSLHLLFLILSYIAVLTEPCGQGSAWSERQTPLPIGPNICKLRFLPAFFLSVSEQLSLLEVSYLAINLVIITSSPII